MMMRICAVILSALLCVTASMAGTVSVKWSTDKEPVSYLSGETMTFHIQLLEDDKPLAGKTMEWVRAGDDRRTATGRAVTSDTQPLEIKTSLDRPGFVHIEIMVFQADGSPLKDSQNRSLKFEGGAGVSPEKLEGYPEPPDFDAFWKSQKTRLAEVPMKDRLTEVASSNADFQVFDVKVDCVGKRPVSGYLTVPNGAKAKSLSAAVGFNGYGARGAVPIFRNGTLSLQINAHGIENGREDEYYRALEQGELKAYGFDLNENAKPETSYFNGMMLRLLRALEFIKSRPEWDGKTLMVSGGSQGGLQAIAAAALDDDVTECSAHKPWCSDLGGVKLGRLGGWRPGFVDGLGYFDTVNMAKRVKCKTLITAGLGDYVCPPSGISVLYNNLVGPKTIEYIQGATHGYDPPRAKTQTLRGD